MKRIARLASAAFAIAFGVCQSGAFAQNADPYCPPGAKFCPTPGLVSSAPDNGFGLGGYAAPSPMTPIPGSHFQAQLNEGEQLIMVAPGGELAPMYPPGLIATPPPASAPVPSGFSGSYAVASASAPSGGYADSSDGLRGFVPPPPGSRPAQSLPEPSYSGYAAAPAPLAVTTAGPAPLTAASFYTPYPEQAAMPAQLPARQPESRPAARQDFARTDDGFSRMAEQPERTHPYQNTSAQQKKTRAEKLSEVANETSRRSGKLDLKPRPENRKPWWKGGFWNRDKDGTESVEKKSRAERKAERREAKLAAQKVKEDAKRAKN